MNPKHALKKYLMALIISEEPEGPVREFVIREAAIMLLMMDMIQEGIEDEAIKRGMGMQP